MLVRCCFLLGLYSEKCGCRSVSRVNDAWFADEDGVRKSVGLLDKPVVEFFNANEVCFLCL